MPKLSYIAIGRPDSFGSFEEFAAVLRRVKDLGYQGVEFNLARAADLEVDALVRFLESIDLPVAAFMTGTNYFSEGLCLSSPQPAVRQRAVERLQESAVVAARFETILVVGQMQGFRSDEPDRAVAEARIEECLKQVVESAEREGVLVVLEPVCHLQTGFNNSLSEVMALVTRIGSACLKPMLDTFHMNIEETSMTEPIYRVGQDLGHFHLCESNGGRLGTGHLDFRSIFDALETIDYSGYVSVKAYRQSWPASAETSIRYLRELLR